MRFLHLATGQPVEAFEITFIGYNGFGTPVVRISDGRFLSVELTDPPREPERGDFALEQPSGLLKVIPAADFEAAHSALNTIA